MATRPRLTSPDREPERGPQPPTTGSHGVVRGHVAAAVGLLHGRPGRHQQARPLPPLAQPRPARPGRRAGARAPAPGRRRWRRYHQADLDWITVCTRLRATGMPIRDMRQPPGCWPRRPTMGTRPARRFALKGRVRPDTIVVVSWAADELGRERGGCRSSWAIESPRVPGQEVKMSCVLDSRSRSTRRDHGWGETVRPGRRAARVNVGLSVRLSSTVTMAS